MSVIDLPLRFPQCPRVLTADDIREELIRKLDAKEVSGVAVASVLGIAPARVTEMRKRTRQVQQREMQPLAVLLGMTDSPGRVTHATDTSHRSTNAQVLRMEGASLDEPVENLPIWGSGLGAAREIDGEAIEQTMLNTGEVVEYVKRPTLLKGKPDCYGLYVQGSSMHPALPDGEMVVATRNAPLSAGDNVVVYLRTADPELDDGSHARAVLVKELVRRTARYVELRQYQPAKDFRIEMDEVLRIDRILTRREMLA